MTPLRTGVALALTVGVFYTLCTVVWIVALGPFLDFMNTLFHKMDFSGMVKLRPFALAGFLAALLALTAWAPLAGMFFAWLSKRLAR